MFMKDFKGLQKQLDVLEAEERLVLQRQLDNHLKVNSKEMLKHFSDIYKEFEDVVYEEIKITKDMKSKIDKKTAQQLWRMSLAKLKGG